MTVKTFDVTKFQDRIMFKITPHKWGARCTIKQSEAYREYMRLTRLSKEETTELWDGNYTPTSTGKAAADQTSATKPLMACPELDAINELLADTKDRLIGSIRGMCNPSFIAKGIYSMRKTDVDTAEKLLESTQAKLRDELLPALKAAIPQAIENARLKHPNRGGLGPIFDETDYPSPDQIIERFWLEWDYLQLGVADDLPEALKAKKLEEWEKRREDALEMGMGALRECFAELISHATEKLTVAPGDKPKTFRDTLIGNVIDFINVFQSRNMGDEKLEELVNKARAIVQPNGEAIDPDRLRKFANVRESVREQFASIQTTLDGMIVDRKSRKIDLSED